MYLEISAAGWYLIGASLLFLILFGLFVLFYLAVKQKQNGYLLKEQKAKHEYEQELLQTQLEIQEQTLKTISQEIHDNIGQVLSLVKLNLNTINDVSEAARMKIGDTKDLVSKAINDLRDLSKSLHGDKITELGLVEAIANELKIIENTGQYTTELKLVSDDAYQLEQQTNIILFRILQEALNNTIKHARASKITVELMYGPERFTLTIIDDGIGFDELKLQASKTGIGLTSIQNRVAMIGGIFSLQTTPDAGTAIRIDVMRKIAWPDPDAVKKERPLG